METTIQPITTLHHLLEYDARKFNYGEARLKNVLPEWIAKADSLKFKEVLRRYLDYVDDHTHKLGSFIPEGEIFPMQEGNRVMESFIKETEEKLESCSDREVSDASLLACIQGINHYKISGYGTAAAFSRSLGMEKEESIFRELEVNEKQIDNRLSQLAEFEINARAITPLSLPGKN